MAVVEQGKLTEKDVPLRNAMNEVLRDAYMKDAERVVRRWNQALEEEGVSERITLPSSRFFRRQGIYANLPFNPAGQLMDPVELEARRHEWLPTDEDRAYVASLMHRVQDPGQMANWIAAPRRGIHGNPVEFEYVRPPAV
jgi:benzoyl-CoA 2,3-dioxygenase component B